MNKLAENIEMALMRVRRAAQLTLPSEVRQALHIKEGDYLEAHIVKDGVLLKPVSVVERKRAWAGIKKAMSGVDDRMPRAGESHRAKEEAIADQVKALRRKHA